MRRILGLLVWPLVWMLKVAFRGGRRLEPRFQSHVFRSPRRWSRWRPF